MCVGPCRPRSASYGRRSCLLPAKCCLRVATQGCACPLGLTGYQQAACLALLSLPQVPVQLRSFCCMRWTWRDRRPQWNAHPRAAQGSLPCWAPPTPRPEAPNVAGGDTSRCCSNAVHCMQGKACRRTVVRLRQTSRVPFHVSTERNVIARLPCSCGVAYGTITTARHLRLCRGHYAAQHELASTDVVCASMGAMRVPGRALGLTVTVRQ